MKAQPSIAKENNTPDIAHTSPQPIASVEANFPSIPEHEAFSSIANNSPQVQQLKAYQSISSNSPQGQKVAQLKAISASGSNNIQRKKNKTGLPDSLKSGIESLSGIDLSDVKVHYNSSQPAQLQAHAFAQGSNIHLASGQEKHLPHEAWHVVQQKQGRVKPTTQLKGKIAINDSEGLEREADIMGAKALQLKSNPDSSLSKGTPSHAPVVQRVYKKRNYRLAQGVTRDMYVEDGDFRAAAVAPAVAPDRAVLHETMVVAPNAGNLVGRFNEETAAYLDTVGLSVVVNAYYNSPADLPDLKKRLSDTGAKLAKESKSKVNIVKALWQDGRPNEDTSIRSEVPFAEMRSIAATDPGSQQLFADLATVAPVVWRKMGDDDMSFPNPNAVTSINKHLAKSEQDQTHRKHMVTFNYHLTEEKVEPITSNFIKEMYLHEARVIKHVKKTFGVPTYAIEPTTYYRSHDEDLGQAWLNYEENADPKNKQIKEGASFAKSFMDGQSIHKYIAMADPIPTDAGGRLGDLITIFEKMLVAMPAIDDFVAILSPVLADIDQSVWDGKTLLRGSEWMTNNDDMIGYINSKKAEVAVLSKTQMEKFLKAQHPKIIQALQEAEAAAAAQL